MNMYESKLDKCLCKICQTYQDKTNFHKIETKIGDKILNVKQLSTICKNCVPIEAIEWSIIHNKIVFNQKIIDSKFLENSINRTATNKNIPVTEIITFKNAMDILGIRTKSKRWINHKVRAGIIRKLDISISPGLVNKNRMTKKYREFYFLKDILILKSILDNGYLILRRPSISQCAEKARHNPPYIIKNKQDREYLFINNKEKRKPCSLCLQIKDFKDFIFRKDGKMGLWCCECSIRYYKSPKNEEKLIRKSLKPEGMMIYSNIETEISRKSKIDNLRLYLSKIIKELIFIMIKDNNINNLNDSYIYPKIGLTQKQLAQYIMSKWQLGMEWSNYGHGYQINENGLPVYDKNGNIIKLNQWHIDHIKCIDSFDMGKEEDLLTVNYYTNLLPMWWEDNLHKANKTKLCPIKDKHLLDNYKELKILVNFTNINNEYDIKDMC